MADAAPIVVHIEDDDDNNTIHIDSETGALEQREANGDVIVSLSDHRPKPPEADHYANLALKIDPNTLSKIANEIHDAVTADDNSRSQYLTTRARGLDLLGLKLEEPKATVGDTSSSSEGMSSVTNPLMLEAILKGWANARAELLPAEGPVKIEVEGDETIPEDDLADALERDMNWYYTTGAPEYYPDTSHMILWGTYFGGSGFKKVYRCPMRRRPVSESVDAKDLIVSDTSKDFRSCGRITHQITMRPSVMKRMMLLGAYRDVMLTQPTPTPNTVDQKIAGIQGVQVRPERPEDQPYTLWETQCELDLPEYAPGKFKDEGIPLPYLVTLDKDSREILNLRRDWDENDAECQRTRMYVKFPLVPGPGFYGTGMLNMLGNSSAALTAVDREGLDAGMFASFPGGLVLKGASRQNTSNFRVGPGEFMPIDPNGSMAINQMVMPMPYRDVTPGLMSMREAISAQAKELSGSVEVPVGEGLQNVPVGTMLAQIEQATKIMSASHKDMVVALKDEMELLIKLFRRHPEDFWRSNDVAPEGFWDADKLVAALNDIKLIPRADPNTPSHIHRIMKAWGLVQLKQTPGVGEFLSGKEIATRCVRALRDDPNGLIVDPPPQAGGPPPDPAKMLAAQANMIKAQTGAQKNAVDAQSSGADATLKAAEISSQERIAGLNLQREEVIHRGDLVREMHQNAMQRDAAVRDHGLEQQRHGLEQQKHALDVTTAAHDMQMAEREHELNQFEATKPEPKPTKPKGGKK